jgi:hypothetical protein
MPTVKGIVDKDELYAILAKHDMGVTVYGQSTRGSFITGVAKIVRNMDLRVRHLGVNKHRHVLAIMEETIDADGGLYHNEIIEVVTFLYKSRKVMFKHNSFLVDLIKDISVEFGVVKRPELCNVVNSILWKYAFVVIACKGVKFIPVQHISIIPKLEALFDDIRDIGADVYLPHFKVLIDPNIASMVECGVAYRAHYAARKASNKALVRIEKHGHSTHVLGSVRTYKKLRKEVQESYKIVEVFEEALNSKFKLARHRVYSHEMIVMRCLAQMRRIRRNRRLGYEDI